MPRKRKPASPFRYFSSSPDIILTALLLYIRYPLSLGNVEDLLFERGIDICHLSRDGAVLVKLARCSLLMSDGNGFPHARFPSLAVAPQRDLRQVERADGYLWRAVDDEDEILGYLVTKKRDKSSAMTFMKKVVLENSSH